MAAASGTCAASASGTVSCWGSNVDGALGDVTPPFRLVPVAVSGLATATAVASRSIETASKGRR